MTRSTVPSPVTAVVVLPVMVSPDVLEKSGKLKEVAKAWVAQHATITADATPMLRIFMAVPCPRLPPRAAEKIMTAVRSQRVVS
jgi:hypothetical protein